MEVICVYMEKVFLEENEECWKIKKGGLTTKRFDSYDSFGKWQADNVAEIIVLDVIQEED